MGSICLFYDKSFCWLDDYDDDNDPELFVVIDNPQFCKRCGELLVIHCDGECIGKKKYLEK
jgi:hypothetical protein